MEPNRPIAGGQGRPFGGNVPPPSDVDDTSFEYDQEEEATPEEQAQYDIVVSRAVKYIHTRGRDSTLKQLSAAESPAEGIGRAAAMIVTAIIKAAKQQGKEFAEGVMFNAGIEIVEELAELGAEAGIFQFDSDQEATEQTEQGLMYAIKYFGEGGLASGLIRPDEVEESKDLMEINIRREAEAGSGNVTKGVRQELYQKPQKRKGGLVNSARGV